MPGFKLVSPINISRCSWDFCPEKTIGPKQFLEAIFRTCTVQRYNRIYLSVTTHFIALLHVGLINVVDLEACAFVRSS